MATSPPTERNIMASRNAWREYALELEWKLDEIMKGAAEERYLPRMEGQRVYAVR